MTRQSQQIKYNADNMAQIILNHIDIKIWNKRHVQFQPHDDVNIIMAINGSGKTTFLKNL